MLTSISLVSDIEKSRFLGKSIKHDALRGKKLVGASEVQKRFAIPDKLFTCQWY